MQQLTYKGFIKESSKYENDCAIFIGETEEPIAEILHDEINGKTVSVRYWISDVEQSKDNLIESILKSLYGAVDARYSDRYSELTGYLWTDEDLNIGGHDLMEELRSNIGKFIWLEIDIH